MPGASGFQQDLPDGLYLMKDFVTDNEAASVVAFVDDQPWAGKGIPPNPGASKSNLKL